MVDLDLCYTPATELARLVRARELSPVEIVANSLERIEQVNPLLNCFCFVYPDEALELARQAEAQAADSQPLGPLHGLPIAVGTALGQRMHQSSGRTFVLVGDGELDEGSNHEAIAVAARLGVANLTAIVIDNQSAMYGWPGGIARRFAVEGWQTAEVDGRDHEAIFTALTAPHDRPYAVVAKIERGY